jgi:cytidine deaminase
MGTPSEYGITPKQLQRLRAVARDAYPHHHASYSKFVALAAVETTVGIFGGANLEIANYTLTKHAEEVAIIAAILAGAGPRGHWLKTLYVVGGPPCGSCRQFVTEFAKPDAVILVDPIKPVVLRRQRGLTTASDDWGVVAWHLGELYPAPFTDTSLRR